MSNVAPVEFVCQASLLMEVRVSRVGVECLGTLESMGYGVPEPRKGKAEPEKDNNSCC